MAVCALCKFCLLWTDLSPPSLHPGILHGTQSDEVGGQVDSVGGGPGGAGGVGPVVEAEVVAHVGISEEEYEDKDEEDVKKSVPTKHGLSNKNKIM